LGFAVDLRNDNDFIGAEALRTIDRTALKLRTVYFTVDDPQVFLIHDETLFADSRQVGRVTSSAYGHTVGRTIGLGVIERGVELDAAFSLRSMGREYSITVSTRPFYDPDSHRMLDA
jgi:4-methylaminobutanoate oxidase (formaldehyde-forming)